MMAEADGDVETFLGMVGLPLCELWAIDFAY